jgi:hypothetical protein
MGSRRCSLLIVGSVVLVGAMAIALSGVGLRGVLALPALQFPTNSVTILSDPPPLDEPGQFTEATLLQANPLDPHIEWRSPTFDDSGWQSSYPAATLPGWGSPVGGAHPAADFIWGGPVGTDVGGRYEIPSSPAPQFLFLRKSFCVPINADINSVQPATPLQMQVAADPGEAALYYNGFDVGNLPGREDGFVYSVDLSAVVAAARRLGRNTLAVSVYDDVVDTRAAVAYYLQMSYAIDPGAIMVNASPTSGSAGPGGPITFSQGGAGPGGDGPYAFGWDFGDGTTSTEPAPSKVYSAAGTYTVTLVMTDRFGCPSAPVSIAYVVAAPTPTDTPTPTNTPTPTSTPVPVNTSAPPPSNPQPTSTPIVLPTPTLTPTAIVPVLLPATGNMPGPVIAGLVFPIVGGILLVVSCLLLRRRLARGD